MPYKALLIGWYDAPYHGMEDVQDICQQMAADLDLDMTVTDDTGAINADTLDTLDVLILYTTGGEIAGHQMDALVSFVEGGKALVGVHGATIPLIDQARYVELIGARFDTHPEQQDLDIQIVDPDHPITRGVQPFTIWDELYLFHEGQPIDVHVLAQTQSYEDRAIPVAWTREPGQGRMFYLSLGHGRKSFTNRAFQNLLKRGILWAMQREGEL